MTPLQFVTRQRIARAQQLIRRKGLIFRRFCPRYKRLENKKQKGT